MEIRDLGAVGEFVSSVAIVVTLIFLTIETRQARNATQQSNRQGRHQIRTNLNLAIASNPQLAEVFAKSTRHLDGETPGVENEFGLSGSEHIQLVVFVLSFFRHLEDQYFSDLPESDRSGLESHARLLLNLSPYSKVWERSKSGFDSRFQQYIDNLLREGTQESLGT